MRAAGLRCPGCGAAAPPDQRLCAICGLPLVVAVDRPPPTDPVRERARKVRPSYARGELVRVAGARNQAEAEFIQALLLEEGVPSLLRRARGFDVPDFLAAGPRDVLVPAGGVEAAREVLGQSGLAGEDAAGPAPLRLFAWLLGGVGILVAVVVVGTELLA